MFLANAVFTCTIRDALEKYSCGNTGSGCGASFNLDRHGITAQRDVIFFNWIEESENQGRHGRFLFVRRDHHLESFLSADSDVVVLFELRGRRISMPAALIRERRSVHSIKIAAAVD